jgi:Ca2+/Na+ antiporter
MVKRMHIVILLYVICLFLIFLYKPAMMFDQNGNIKHFDYENNNTSGSLLNIEIVLCTFAMICYFIVLALELMIF